MPLVSKMMSTWHVLNIFQSCNLWQHMQLKTIIIHPLWNSWDSWGSVTLRGSLNCSFRRKDKVGVPLSPLVLETMTWWQPSRANDPGWTSACLPLFQTPTQSHWLPNEPGIRNDDQIMLNDNIYIYWICWSHCRLGPRDRNAYRWCPLWKISCWNMISKRRGTQNIHILKSPPETLVEMIRLQNEVTWSPWSSLRSHEVGQQHTWKLM